MDMSGLCPSGKEVQMKAFEYILNDNEIINMRLGDSDVLHPNVLMLYPNYMYDNDINNVATHVALSNVDGYGNKTHTTITEGPDNGEWFIYILTHDVRGNVSEWEYTSEGGYNPIMYLQSFYINGEQQEILYRVR